MSRPNNNISNSTNNSLLNSKQTHSSTNNPPSNPSANNINVNKITNANNNNVNSVVSPSNSSQPVVSPPRPNNNNNPNNSVSPNNSNNNNNNNISSPRHQLSDDNISRAAVIALFESFAATDPSCKVLLQSLRALAPNNYSDLDSSINLNPSAYSSHHNTYSPNNNHAIYYPQPDPTVLLHIINTIKASSTPKSISFVDWHRSLAYLCLLLSYHIHKLLVNLLLNNIEKVQPHIEYWRNNPRLSILQLIQKKLKTSYTKNSSVPHSQSKPKSSSKASNSETNNHKEYVNLMYNPRYKLQYLLRFRKKWLSRVGRLSNRVSKLSLWLSISLSSQNMISAMEQTALYTEQLYSYITGSTARKANGINDVLNLLEECLLSFDELFEWWELQVKQYRKPTHLQLYWPHYVGATILTAFTAKTAYKYRFDIIDTVKTTYSALYQFTTEHLFEPVKNIYSSVFQRFQSNTGAIGNAIENYKQSKLTLNNMLLEYGKEHAEELSKLESISVRDYLKSLPNRAQQQDMTIVMHNYETEVKQPIKSVVFGDLLRGLLIQTQKVKADGEAAMLSLDQILKTNEINFELMAAIPAILLIFGCVRFGSNTIKTVLFRRPDNRDIYRIIREKLREIEQLLIQYLHPTNLIDNNNELFTHLRAYQQLKEKQEMEELVEALIEQHGKATVKKYVNNNNNNNNSNNIDNDSDNNNNNNNSPLNNNNENKNNNNDESTVNEGRSPELRAGKSSNNNTNNNDNTVMNNDDFYLYMRDWSYGQLLLLCYELNHHISFISKRKQKLLRNDIQMLTYAHFTPQQKLLFIQQIFHSHTYLNKW